MYLPDCYSMRFYHFIELPFDCHLIAELPFHHTVVVISEVITQKYFWHLLSCFWLVPKATNLWFCRVSHAGVLVWVQCFSGVFSLVIYITWHIITAEDLRGSNKSKVRPENVQIESVNFGQNKKVGSTI